jgi:RAB protein geranylgeranyltransferase component A
VKKKKRRRKGNEKGENNPGDEGESKQVSQFKDIKVWKMIGYCICGFKQNFETIENVTARDFLAKFSLFVRSMGVHDKMPYLYPMYGIADITQVFSRICAVYGGNFLLDKELQVTQVEKSKSTSTDDPIKRPYTVTLSKNDEHLKFGCDHLISGPEYNHLIKSFIGEQKKQDTTAPIIFRSVHIVCKCNYSIDAAKIPYTTIYPEGSKGIDNDNMIRVNVLGWNSKNTPLENVYLNVSFLSYESSKDSQHMKNMIKTLVADCASVTERELSLEFWFAMDRSYQ